MFSKYQTHFRIQIRILPHFVPWLNSEVRSDTFRHSQAQGGFSSDTVDFPMEMLQGWKFVTI